MRTPVFTGSCPALVTPFDAHGTINYAAFGKLTEGLDVLDSIAGTDCDYNDRPRTEQKMKRVSVDTFGTEYPEPEKV